ncbi:helix-turn-helix domain-containing protein [Vibrio aestuarianus]|uniref:helix-turn-helix domain-containing protein n=1 Tax=Vibrio aestuarianus TaxID=28171 RepID=UPI003BAAB130
MHNKDIRIAYSLVDLHCHLERCGVLDCRIKISQSLLASSSKISRPKLNFVLKKFESDNLITIRRGGIIIDDMNGLKNILLNCNLMFFDPLKEIRLT